MSEFKIQPKAEMKQYLKDNTLAKDLFYLIVKVKESKKPEIIINPKANLNGKLEYLDKTYDDKLVMVHNSDIKIVDYGVIKSSATMFEDIQSLYN